ncbi:capsid protein [Brucella anthropi]|uniref:capsid protein n=1 Tax=Brucella anthropi TaxID=529 RepID=UPI002360D757|nr:capsid protein [Brucella anthropi]
MSTNRPFVVSPTLTAIAIAYRNPDHVLIGDRLLPGVPVLSEAFKWTKYPIEQSFTVPDARVGRKGQVNRVEFQGQEEDSSTDDFGFDSEVPNSDIAAAAAARKANLSAIDPLALATETLSDLLVLSREVRQAAVMQNPANYSPSRRIVLTGQQKFSDTTNSDPFGVIDDAMGKTLVYRPNTISMGFSAWSKIKRHPKLIKAVKGGLTEDGAISKQQFADLFEISVDRLLVGEAWLNIARKGQAADLQRVWGDSIQLTYVNSTKQDAKDGKITFGFTAELGTRISGTIIDPDIGLEGGERVRVGERVKELVCAKDVGVIIQNPF